MPHYPTRYNKDWIFYIIAGIVTTPLISLFLFQLFCAVLFLLFIFEKNGYKLKSFDAFAYLIAAFAVIRIISILLSEFPDASFRAFPKEILFYTTFFSLIYYLKVFDKKSLIKLADYFIWAGVLVSVVGILFFVSGSVNRAQSFGSGYSTYSSYLLVVLVFRLSKKSKGDLKSVLIWAIQTGLILTGIVLAMGRANIAIALFSIVVLFYIRKINLKPVLIAIIFTVILSLSSFQANNYEINKRVENVASLSDRDILLKGFGMIYQEHPFIGFGPRTFHEIFPLQERLNDKGIGSWHNEYIQTYIESGLVAISILLILILAFFKLAKKMLFNRDLDEDISFLSISAIFGTISLLLSGVTGAFLYSPILSVLFGFLLSLFSATYYITNHLE